MNEKKEMKTRAPQKGLAINRIILIGKGECNYEDSSFNPYQVGKQKSSGKEY